MINRSFILLSLALLSTSCCRPYQQREVVCETYVHPYGIEMQPVEWKEKGESGQVVTTLTNGVNETRNYNQGKLHGECIYTFPYRTEIERIETYNHGDLTKQQDYYPSGVLKEETEFTGPDTRVEKHFYTQGAIRCTETFENDRLMQARYFNTNKNAESGIENGVGKRTLRDEYGQLISVDYFDNGHMASSTTYHANGTPKEILTYRGGQIDGECKTFLPGGEPAEIAEWVNGVQEGTTTVFRDGEKVAEVPYVNGKKEGIEQRFIGNKVVEELTWKNGKLDGPTYRYVDGNIVTEYYFNNQRVSKANYDTAFRGQR